ncbi:hypothetical protein HS7_14260 [Sulfolobales archaeon HS-7]|nr:hypothetical protein HS7_14260 [Sulfolobales archaeon HS-7]
MGERGVQTIDGLVEQLAESKDALEEFLALLNALQKSGILPLLIGIVEKLDENLAFLAEQNAIFIRNVNVIYSVLSGKEEVGNVSLGELIRELNDPDVRRGLHLVLKVLKAIGSASKKS